MLPLYTFQGPSGCFRTRTAAKEWSASLRHQPLLETVEGMRPNRNITQSLGAFSSVQAQAEPGPSTSGQTSLCEAESQNCRPGLDAESLVHNSESGWAESLAVSGLWLSEHSRLLPSHFMLPIQVNKPPAQQIQKQTTRPGKDPKKREDFYANVGEAIRVLRAEIPLLFQEDLTYDIYRDDITFRDPRNTFRGKKDYKTIFWSLRFHGKLFFKVLYVDVLRIWESPENVTDAGTVLKMRWSVHGIPRVPWDAEGIFDGISTFKLDSSGKIYEHAVNNIILKDPPKQGNPFLAGLNLIPLPQQQQPCPGAWFKADCRTSQEDEEGRQRAGGKSGGGSGSVACASLVEEF